MNCKKVFMLLPVLLFLLLNGCGLVEITTPTEPIHQQATQAPTQTPTDAPTDAPAPTQETALPTTEPSAAFMDTPVDAEPIRYVLNTNTYKFHVPECKSVKDIREENKAFHTGTREQAIEMGFEPCKNCNP